jgi:hypothetical protein
MEDMIDLAYDVIDDAITRFAEANPEATTGDVAAAVSSWLAAFLAPDDDEAETEGTEPVAA